MELTSPERILLRAPNWLGDVVMTTPAMRALRSHFKEAHITVQVRPELAGILDPSPFVDEVIPVDSYHKGFAAMVKEGSALHRRGGFDLGICAPESISSALLMRFAGVRRVVGYGSGVRALFVHDRVEMPREWGARRMVARERFVLGLVESLGCKEVGTHCELATSKRDDARVQSLLAEHIDASTQPIVVFAPGASYGSSKCWPVPSFATVGDALNSRGFQVVLLGTAAEARLTGELASSMQTPAIDFAGALSLSEVKSLIKRSSLLVCNDAGARHIAAAFDIPSIVFFGPTSVEKTNLNLETVQVLETNDSCRPCYKRECPIDHRCMTGISPSRVIDLSLASLDAAS